MIVEYYRPQSVKETLELIANPETKTVLMGGGTTLDRFTTEPFAVVDLQDVGLNTLRATKRTLEIGATVTLQILVDNSQVQEALKSAIYGEASFNLRQVATVAGTLVAASGRSPFTTAMLALDASISLKPGDENISLGDLLPLRNKALDTKLISKITIPVNVQLAYEYVARTLADLPIVCAAVAIWPSGRVRVILGGTGQAPIMAMDGPEKNGAEESARAAYSHAQDQWASAEYRQEMAQVLVRRCLSRVGT
jgi:putative selenate reductase FAD-binding subunit